MGRVPQIEIVRRAYKIWQESGQPDGKDDEFYHRAERELENEQDRDAAENKTDETIPPAGPHAKPELTDKDKTPGAGTLPEPGQPEVEGPTG